MKLNTKISVMVVVEVISWEGCQIKDLATRPCTHLTASKKRGQLYLCLLCMVHIANGLYSATSLARLWAVTHWQSSPLYSIWTWSEDGIKLNLNRGSNVGLRSTAQCSNHCATLPLHNQCDCIFLGFSILTVSIICYSWTLQNTQICRIMCHYNL